MEPVQYCEPSMSSHTRPDHADEHVDFRYDTRVETWDAAEALQVGHGNRYLQRECVYWGGGV